MAHKPALESDADKLRRRNRELSILNTIAEALNREVDLDQSLRTALAQVAELFGLRTGWIFLFPTEGDVPYLAAAQELPPALAEDSCQLMEGGSPLKMMARALIPPMCRRDATASSA